MSTARARYPATGRDLAVESPAPHTASGAGRLAALRPFSTESLKELVRRAVAGDWVDHANYWAVACDYDSGRRTPFGRLGSPRAEIGDAVAASCAIPGFYRPVTIGRRSYVDGEVFSPSNLDLLPAAGSTW